jgi:hypothetical protein
MLCKQKCPCFFCFLFLFLFFVCLFVFVFLFFLCFFFLQLFVASVIFGMLNLNQTGAEMLGMLYIS